MRVRVRDVQEKDSIADETEEHLLRVSPVECCLCCMCAQCRARIGKQRQRKTRVAVQQSVPEGRVQVIHLQEQVAPEKERLRIDS